MKNVHYDKDWEDKVEDIIWNKQDTQLFSTDLTRKIQKLEIPVYFFSGVYDLTVNYELSKSYLEQLEAPVKGFYTFDQSAHSPLFEEPQKMKYILREDVLKGESSLADQL